MRRHRIASNAKAARNGSRRGDLLGRGQQGNQDGHEDRQQDRVASQHRRAALDHDPGWIGRGPSELPGATADSRAGDRGRMATPSLGNEMNAESESLIAQDNHRQGRGRRRLRSRAARSADDRTMRSRVPGRRRLRRRQLDRQARDAAHVDATRAGAPPGAMRMSGNRQPQHAVVYPKMASGRCGGCVDSRAGDRGRTGDVKG